MFHYFKSQPFKVIKSKRRHQKKKYQHFFHLTPDTLLDIAYITMLIDHVGAYWIEPFLYGGHGSYLLLVLYSWLRAIGRIAFPIFAFSIAEGYIYTRKTPSGFPLRYALRLFVFALVSEPTFDYAHQALFNSPAQANVGWTLLFGLLALWLSDVLQEKWLDPNLQKGLRLRTLTHFLSWVIFGGVATFVGGDYGAWGVGLILLFDLRRYIHDTYLDKWKKPITILLCLMCITLNIWHLLSLPLIHYAYKHGRGERRPRKLDYAIYPVSNLIFGLVRHLLLPL